MRPAFENLFIVSEPLNSGSYRGEFEPHISRSVALELSRGELPQIPNLGMRWAMGGSTPEDLVWTTLGIPLIVHTRVVELLQDGALTGWTTYPIDVRSPAGDSLAEFHGLTITGRCGPADLAQSDVVLRHSPGGWFPYFLGRYFAPQSWDGSDMFMELPDPLGNKTAHRLVTARLREMFVAAEVRNIEFSRLTEHCVPCSIYTVGKRQLLPPDFQERVTSAYQKANAPMPPRVQQWFR